MKTAQLPRYVGPLSPAEAAEGMRLAVSNGLALTADAELLFAHERWPRAASLAILAMEEGGKPSLLRAILLVDDDKARKEEWRAYRRHTAKTLIAGVVPFLPLMTSGRLEAARPFSGEELEPRVLFESVKQLGFYTDALRKGRWIHPSEFVDREVAGSMIQLAKDSVLPDAAFETEPELAIWVRHMKPVWRTDFDTMQAALRDAYREAAEAGVLRGPRSLDQMLEFLSPGDETGSEAEGT